MSFVAHVAARAAVAGLCLLLGPALAQAQDGAAGEQVAIVDTPTHAYGYSAYSGTWTSTTLEAPAAVRLAGGALGYLRSGLRIHAFNATNAHWYGSTYSGYAMGESAEGSTLIFWSSEAAYAIASLWTIWRSQPFTGELPIGGGSAGTFGLVWTSHDAYAFHSASGQWMRQALDGGCRGGITLPNLGLVWTPSALYTFDPTPGGWVALDLGEPDGISVAAASGIALAWSAQGAVAYTNTLDLWIPLEGDVSIAGGAVDGGIGIVWNRQQASAFDAATGLWTTTPVAGMPDSPPPPKDIPVDLDPGSGGFTFRIGPNPARGDHLRLQLPPGIGRDVQIFDAAGRVVRSWQAAGSAGGPVLSWDRTDDTGRQVPAGVYWARAQAEDAVEVRRIVLLD